MKNKYLDILIILGLIIVLGIVILGLTEANAKIFNYIGDKGYSPDHINKWIPKKDSSKWEKVGGIERCFKIGERETGAFKDCSK